MQREGEVEGSRGCVEQDVHGLQRPRGSRHVEGMVAEGVLLVRVLENGSKPLEHPSKSIENHRKASKNATF